MGNLKRPMTEGKEWKRDGTRAFEYTEIHSHLKVSVFLRVPSPVPKIIWLLIRCCLMSTKQRDMRDTKIWHSI